MPGASAYFLGGAVVYTRDARRLLMEIGDAEMKGLRSSSEPYAKLLASQMRQRFSTTWGLSETGAAGPTGNRYGDAAGHTCMAVAGPNQAVFTLETGSADRQANMQEFAKTALNLLLKNSSRGNVERRPGERRDPYRVVLSVETSGDAGAKQRAAAYGSRLAAQLRTGRTTATTAPGTRASTDR